MTDLIGRICEAIFRQEGMGPDHTNPGNLRDAPWFPGSYQQRFYLGPAPQAKLKFVKGYWVPRTRMEGIAGAAHVVALHIAKGETLSQLIHGWAPAGDGANDPKVYVEHVKEWAAIPDENEPLWTYL